LGYGTLGALPLVVIRRGKTATPPSASDIAWQADQERLTTLSTSSSLVVAENAGHVIPYDAPGVVADAVRRVLTACRMNERVK
jgi:pimeloyl-ACP methyl ester carboxylesterase